MGITAFVLINTTSRETAETLSRLKASPFVKSAHAVTGPYDIIALIEADDVAALGRMVTQQMHDLPGIEHTLTSIVLF